MAVRKTTKRLYLIPVLSKALDILELLQAENQPMTLEAIHRQTRISKTTVSCDGVETSVPVFRLTVSVTVFG